MLKPLCLLLHKHNYEKLKAFLMIRWNLSQRWSIK